MPKVRFYGSMIVLSFILNIIFVLYLTKNTKMRKEERLFLILLENFGIIIGGKLLTLITENFKNNFFSVGFSSMGGVIGGIIGILLFCLIFNKSIRYIFNYTLITFPLMYSIGKIGCFVAGCCYGIEYSGLGSIIYHKSKVAPLNVSLFPVQLLESIVFLLIFVYTLYNRYKKENIEIMLVLCGVAKFSLDFLRSSHIEAILSLNQYLCLLFIFIGIIVLLKNGKRVEKDEM